VLKNNSGFMIKVGGWFLMDKKGCSMSLASQEKFGGCAGGATFRLSLPKRRFV